MNRSLFVEIECFLRFGRRFYNCRLVTVNAVGAQMIHRIDEYHDKSKLSELAQDACICAMKNDVQISEFLREGERQLQVKTDFETQG